MKNFEIITLMNNEILTIPNLKYKLFLILFQLIIGSNTERINILMSNVTTQKVLDFF